MVDIIAVLLIPAYGDPGELLRRDRCGGLPPRAGMWVQTWYLYPWPDDSNIPYNALVLWWDSALVKEGWDRARRVWWAHEPAPMFRRVTREFEANLEDCLDCGRRLVTAGKVARVVRLARVDGRLVEVE